MNEKSVVFIEPAGSESNVFEHYMRLPLLGTLYLGTILHNEGYGVRVFNENILPHPIDPFDIQADVYCISALTVSSGRGIHLAREFRRLYPQARIIIGGIHASLSPQTFEEVADTVVHGEAESIIVDLVEGRLSEKVVYGSPVEDLDTLPLINYRLLENGCSMSTIPIMTSRGCPFDCNFCTVTKIFGRKFRMQSAGRIIEEVKNALSFFRARTIFFYDDNFTANRERLRELCGLIRREKIEVSWMAQVRSDIAREPELLKQMHRSGCRYFFIGFESIDDDTLKAMHKSQTRRDIEYAIRTIRRNRISIHGMFMFGEDHDTPENIHRTVDFAINHHIDTVQFMIITPFPGTQYYKEIDRQNRIIHKRWEYYNAMFAVFRPANMSATRLQRETIAAYERFYSLKRLSLDALRLFSGIFIDALTFNFHAVYRYNFDIILLKAGARFLVGRYARTFDPYIDFLRTTDKRGTGSSAAGATHSVTAQTTI